MQQQQAGPQSLPTTVQRMVVHHSVWDTGVLGGKVLVGCTMQPRKEAGQIIKAQKAEETWAVPGLH